MPPEQDLEFKSGTSTSIATDIPKTKDHKMDPYTTDPSKLFSVEGMVVVITGGGVSNEFPLPKKLLSKLPYWLAGWLAS